MVWNYLISKQNGWLTRCMSTLAFEKNIHGSVWGVFRAEWVYEEK